MSEVSEEQLISIKENIEEIIKIKTDELKEIMRIFQNVKGIQLDKGKLPKIVAGTNQMSKAMRKEIFDAVKGGCENFNISTEIRKKPIVETGVGVKPSSVPEKNS